MVSSDSIKRKITKETNRLRNFHNRINACALSFSYAPSFRSAKNKNVNRKALRTGGFVIHNFRPSVYDKETDVVGRVTSVHKSQFAELTHLNLPPEPDWNDPEFVTAMPRHWPSLRVGVHYRDFIREQGDKHGRYAKFVRPVPYYETAFRKGMKFVSPEGKHYLMGILERKGYEFGNVYPCQVLVNDIEEAIHGGVEVTFRLLPNFTEVNYLHEVVILYDDYAKREKKKRVQSFDSHSKFLLEDFNVRYGAV